jgi:hypothetical protein
MDMNELFNMLSTRSSQVHTHFCNWLIQGTLGLQLHTFFHPTTCVVEELLCNDVLPRHMSFFCWLLFSYVPSHVVCHLNTEAFLLLPLPANAC